MELNPEEHFPRREVYILASEERVYGAGHAPLSYRACTPMMWVA